MFVANVAVANLLGRETFGELGMVQNTLLTVSGISQVATGVTATKYVAEFRTADKERAGRMIGLCSAVSLVTGIAATLLLLAASPMLAEQVYRAPRLARVLMLSAGYVLFSVMNGFQAGALAGLEGFGLMARAGVLLGLFHAGACILGARAFGLEGAAMGLVASAAVRWFLYRKMLASEAGRHGIRVTTHGVLGERAILFRFALPAAISGLTALPALWLSSSLLVRQPGGFREMGLYSAANSVRMIALFLPSVMNSVGMAMLNQKRGAGEADGYRRVFWTNMAFTAGSVLAVAAGVLLFGGAILGLFGKEFRAGGGLLFILMLSTLPEALAIAGAQVIQSRAEMWKSFFAIAVPRDAAMVALAFFLVPRHGAEGLAWAYATAWIGTMLTVGILVRRAGLGIR